AAPASPWTRGARPPDAADAPAIGRGPVVAGGGAHRCDGRRHRVGGSDGPATSLALWTGPPRGRPGRGPPGGILGGVPGVPVPRGGRAGATRLLRLRRGGSAVRAAAGARSAALAPGAPRLARGDSAGGHGPGN